MKFTINIPNPCSENWNKMTPTEKGRHCAVCEKDLTDFKLLTDQQIFDLVDSDQKICGRFSVDQLNTEFYAKREHHFSKLGLVVGFTSLVAMVQPAIAQTSVNTIEQYRTEQKPVSIKSIQSDSITITGVVRDEYEPLPFATVVIKNRDTIGVNTDFDGAFSLKVPTNFFDKGEVYVDVQYIGYLPQRILITKETTNLEIELYSDVIIGEVVIVKKPSVFKRFIDLFRRKKNRRYAH